MSIKKATLVLEGGATRGVFTSGVLDLLMEKEIYTSHVIGVSAGACNALSYASRLFSAASGSLRLPPLLTRVAKNCSVNMTSK